MKNVRSVLWLCALCASLAITLNPSAFAQVPAPYHPNQKLSFRVTFEGLDVSKLTGANVYLNLQGPIRGDEQGFTNQIGLGQWTQISPGVFEVSTTIATNVATGTYSLVEVDALAGAIRFTYRDHLPELTISFDNNDHVKRPELKGIIETSKP